MALFLCSKFLFKEYVYKMVFENMVSLPGLEPGIAA